jgi:hypothetical protein
MALRPVRGRGGLGGGVMVYRALREVMSRLADQPNERAEYWGFHGAETGERHRGDGVLRGIDVAHRDWGLLSG